jgi:hypothetical protein
MTSPYVLWYSGTYSATHNESLCGSPVWRVGYLLALVGMAEVAALLHGADGVKRTQLLRAFTTLLVLAPVLLLVAALTGNDYTVLPG